ncbi:MAG: hypothetical protein QHJ34_09565 [bacterium]|jgi:hypothetical protein|nr:hypothetical protein [candidate division KSB1 bacterium]MDH7560464.1 hypothetical protein [bacterium]
MLELGCFQSRLGDKVLTYPLVPVDNGFVEAMNASVKTMSIRPRGRRSTALFSGPLLHSLGSLKRFTSVHKFG